MHRRDADGKDDYDDDFSPVPHASGFLTILSLPTASDMHLASVDISQAFVQGKLLQGDGFNGKVYISDPPGYNEEYVYLLRRYGMPSAAGAWHTTFSAFLARKGCTTVGFEHSTWTMEKDGHQIILAAHIDDFILASSNLAFLEAFRERLLDAFEGTT